VPPSSSSLSSFCGANLADPWLPVVGRAALAAAPTASEYFR
jgi:hypothetical protein